MRILEGRFFRGTDISSPVRPMLVNASFARTYFADGRPVAGRRFMALVLREGLGVTAVGLLLGMAVAALAVRAIAHVLFGVAPLDPVAFVVAPLVLAAVAVAACMVPAWRAAAIDPAEALSAE